MEVKVIIKDLINVLKQQTDLYKQLKNIISDENNDLKRQDIKSIENTLNEEEKLIEKISELEKNKQKIFQNLIDKLGFNDKEVKLNDVLLKIDKEDADEIKKVTMELLNTVKEIDNINSKNIHIIKNYLNYFDFVNKIKDQQKENTKNIIYDAKAITKIQIQPNSPKIDKKI